MAAVSGDVRPLFGHANSFTEPAMSRESFARAVANSRGLPKSVYTEVFEKCMIARLGGR